MNQLSKTGIEYGEYGWNFYPGCLHKPQGICPLPNCWAEGMSKRQREDFHKPMLIPERILAPLERKKPARILVDFMGDLFGDWVNPDMPLTDIFPCVDEDDETLRDLIFDVIKHCPQHTFIFLTKALWNLKKWGRFPNNCWVGATVCNEAMYLKALKELHEVDARVKWLSIEPLYEELHQGHELLEWAGIRWVVIGAQTNPTVYPKASWVQNILVDCHNAGICPSHGGGIWIKDNLVPMLEKEWPGWASLQELPK
jgi:protein gp37